MPVYAKAFAPAGVGGSGGSANSARGNFRAILPALVWREPGGHLTAWQGPVYFSLTAQIILCISDNSPSQPPVLKKLIVLLSEADKDANGSSPEIAASFEVTRRISEQSGCTSQCKVGYRRKEGCSGMFLFRGHSLWGWMGTCRYLKMCHGIKENFFGMSLTPGDYMASTVLFS